MLQNLDKLIKDLTPIIVALAPLVTSLIAYFTARNVKARRSRRRRKLPIH
jgi:hypothetical protein